MIYSYTPDDYMDLGDLGEHPVTYTALIIFNGPDTAPSVSIMKAIVSVTIGSATHYIDVTKLAHKYLGKRERIEKEILGDYRKAQEARVNDWDGGDAA